MKKFGIPGFFLIACIFCFSSVLYAQDQEEIPENVTQNEQCFKCHGSPFYYYYNEWVEKDVRERMNPYFVFDSAEYYLSNHRSFVCTDCHSTDYEEFPHDGSLRMEPKYTCMDCHEGDDTFAHFKFEEIVSEFEQSVHSDRHSDDFTCWMCHNPHTYHINARTSESVVNTIAYDNGICLSCHADLDMYNIILDEENPNLLNTHDWLPNQGLHFANVRCIECHAQINDSLLVAHLVLPKEQAVQLCTECHSSNSLMMASLYKHQTIVQRGNIGFVNAAILNEAYVVGANRNYYLNIISAVIFGLTLLGIFTHAILRAIIKKQ